MAYVYRHIRIDLNEPFYIGIGKTIYRPFDVKNRSKYWNNIVSKTDYRVEILFDDLTYEQAKEKEKEFILLYGRKDLSTGTLVNMTDGGEGSVNRTVSEKNKILTSKRFKGIKRGPMSSDIKMKLSQAKIGKKLTQETIQKMKAVHLNRNYKPSEETKNKIKKTKQLNGSPLSKIILNFSTGIYYNSAKEASDLLHIPLITVYRLCKGTAKSLLNNLKYV